MSADRPSKGDAERSSDGGIDVGHIGIGAAVITAAVAVALAGAWLLIWSFGGTLHGIEVRPAPMAQPALEQHPLLDRRVFDKQDREKLSQYAWIDRQQGIVRIPIDTAIAVLSERAPSRDPGHEGSSP